MSMLLVQRTEEYKSAKRRAEELGVQMAALREELKTWKESQRERQKSQRQKEEIRELWAVAKTMQIM